MSELPGELIELIIDCLASDSALPLEFSLISHLWLPRNRYHRFASLHLEVGWPGDEYSLGETEYLLELAASPLATFIPYVRTVAVTHKWDVRVDGRSVLSPQEIMSTLEECGVRPTALVLDCLGLFSVPPPPQDPPAFSAAGCVTRLVVNLQENNAALDGIVHYFCAFQTLEVLQIEGTPHELHEIPPDEEHLRVPPLLKSISTAEPVVLKWFSRSDEGAFPRDLTRLELCGVPSHGFKWAAVNECLQKPLGKHIKALALRNCRIGKIISTPLLLDFQLFAKFGATQKLQLTIGSTRPSIR
ncbi:hypothetical protein HMN09_00321400 [Mycena chlorophos]|uniref:Uncharacterized protein n=1 Tax=Mycena chlorophos TaxID=658473 RepID=A0A8H6WGT2_MYCCL|nr:hypothetical protein HMN09_00321400 [Mycena chlorophos]